MIKTCRPSPHRVAASNAAKGTASYDLGMIWAAASPEAAALFRVLSLSHKHPYCGFFNEVALSSAFVRGRVRFFTFAEGGHGSEHIAAGRRPRQSEFSQISD